jgi:hypothetical protein
VKSLLTAGLYRREPGGQAVYPRPLQDPLPIWAGVGGAPAYFVRAGMLGLPLKVAIIGGEPRRFHPLNALLDCVERRRCNQNVMRSSSGLGIDHEVGTKMRGMGQLAVVDFDDANE